MYLFFESKRFKDHEENVTIISISLTKKIETNKNKMEMKNRKSCYHKKMVKLLETEREKSNSFFFLHMVKSAHYQNSPEKNIMNPKTAKKKSCEKSTVMSLN